MMGKEIQMTSPIIKTLHIQVKKINNTKPLKQTRDRLPRRERTEKFWLKTKEENMKLKVY